MLKNFAVAMLPILALGTEIVYQNARKVDKNNSQYWAQFQTYNRAAEPDSGDWIAEDAKKLDVEFTIVDPKKQETTDELSKDLKEAENQFAANADTEALEKAKKAANDKADLVKGSIVINFNAIEIGFVMTTDDDDVIDTYRYRQWRNKTAGENMAKLYRRTFKTDGGFEFGSDDFEDWSEEVPDVKFEFTGDGQCKTQKDEDGENTGLLECDYIKLKVRRNFVEDSEEFKDAKIVNNNFETISENYWGWMRSLSQEVVNGDDWNGDEEEAWKPESSDTALFDYTTSKDGLAVETISKGFATTEAMRKAGQEGIDQFERGFDGWYGPLYDMAKSIADDFQTWDVWWNNQDGDVQDSMSDDMKQQWVEELKEWDLTLQKLSSVRQYYLAHISVFGSEMENAKTAAEVEAVMAKIDEQKNYATGQVFKEMKSLANKIEEKAMDALLTLTAFQRKFEEGGDTFKKVPKTEEE